MGEDEQEWRRDQVIWNVLLRYTVVEAHCCGIGKTGQILEQSRSRNRLNVKRFDHEGLHQFQYKMKTFMVKTFYIQSASAT